VGFRSAEQTGRGVGVAQAQLFFSGLQERATECATSDAGIIMGEAAR
jgi:hypothetical protein